MTVIGYTRVSTTDQGLSIRKAALCAVGCDTIRVEKRSGTISGGLQELQTILDLLCRGELLVTGIDRPAHSIGDLQDIGRSIKTRGASSKVTEQPIDTGTAAGKCFLDGMFAEFEVNPRRRHQLEGIARERFLSGQCIARAKSPVGALPNLHAFSAIHPDIPQFRIMTGPGS
jgi:DNA invertase Pin-like site-specific DNA recombinase